MDEPAFARQREFVVKVLSAASCKLNTCQETGLEVRTSRWEWHEQLPAECRGASTVLATDVVYRILAARSLLTVNYQYEFLLQPHPDTVR